MTDNEIIKALECCNKPVGSNSCVDCPLYKINNCSETMIFFALDLINRQKAEIERLQLKNREHNKANRIITRQKNECDKEINHLQKQINGLHIYINQSKTEVERLKEYFNPDSSYEVRKRIDKILKEMGVEG